jgi:hypothetical protein
VSLNVSEKLIELAGFMLADALWTAFTRTGDGAFAPYAKVIQDGNLDTVQFVAESEHNKDAATQAYDYLIEHADEYFAWALAVDMFMLNLGNRSDLKDLNLDELDMSRFEVTDTIQISAWEQGIEEPVTVQQPYKPPSRGGFKVIGTPYFVVGDEILGESQTSGQLNTLRSGFMQHSKAADHWEDWT